MRFPAVCFSTLIGAALLTACGQHTQYSSGSDYLARHVERLEAVSKGAAGSDASDIDEKILKAANVEPNLIFPGRFGIARVINGQLSTIPLQEADAWTGLAERLGGLGEFLPISPLVAELASGGERYEPNAWQRPVGQTIEMIRLGAARQHVDAVLIYEVGARSSNTATPFALADLTLIGGAFLPTREITAEGRASAMFVDVLNAYPYGTATAAVDLSSYYISWGSDRRTEQKRDEAIQLVMEKLIPNVEEMMLDLKQKANAGPRRKAIKH